MAAEASTLVPQTTPTTTDDSLGIDRAFAIQMARMPLLAVGWFLAAIVAHQIWAAIHPAGLNGGPLVVVCAGMILAAFIDGWALKVPNWVTLPLILSGWLLGLSHNLGLAVDSGTGGFGMAFMGTVFAFALLFPMLAIRGVGEGDVKMQMGFGAWVGAFFGTRDHRGGRPRLPASSHGSGLLGLPLRRDRRWAVWPHHDPASAAASAKIARW